MHLQQPYIRAIVTLCGLWNVRGVHLRDVGRVTCERCRRVAGSGSGAVYAQGFPAGISQPPSAADVPDGIARGRGGGVD